MSLRSVFVSRFSYLTSRYWILVFSFTPRPSSSLHPQRGEDKGEGALASSTWDLDFLLSSRFTKYHSPPALSMPYSKNFSHPSEVSFFIPSLMIIPSTPGRLSINFIPSSGPRTKTPVERASVVVASGPIIVTLIGTS